MALERRNPLPPGIYWQTFSRGKQFDDFAAYRATHKSTIRVLKTEESETHVWILFQVSMLVAWDARRFGFPSIAENGARESQPQFFVPEKDFTDRLADALPSPAVFTGVLWFAAIGAGVYATLQFLKQAKE